jgi:hypothetical protein
MGWYMLKDILLISWGSAYYQPNITLVPWDLDKFDHDLTSRRYNSPKAALYSRLVTYYDLPTHIYIYKNIHTYSYISIFMHIYIYVA